MVVRGKGREPSVLNRLSDGKMVKVLKCVIRESENLMGDIIKETSHPRTPHTVGLRIEIKHLPDHARLPVKPPVEKRISFYILPEP